MFGNKGGARVLWVRFWALGDVLQSAAEARLFKKRFPDTHLTFLTKPEYADIIREQTWCDDVITGDKKPMSKFFETLKAIKSKKFDAMISATQGGRTALLGLLSRIPVRVGTCPAQFLYHHKLDEWSAEAGIDFSDRSDPALTASDENVERAKKMLGEIPSKILLAIVGASSEKKMWSLENWEKFLNGILSDDWRVVLIGHGKIEEEFADELAKKIRHKNVTNMAGKLSLVELGALAQLCRACVGNDTGTLHLVALSGVPTIGPSDYDQYERFGYRMPWFVGLNVGGKPKYRANSDKGRSRELLNSISPEKVQNELNLLLTKFPPPTHKPRE